ncbi:hypothetical protein [Actinomycetospora callitridis]|uniref:hypothetical protein n=1 Tax=Actinomycetospora callitridis TaxID=913944 RepID=UPI002365D421|nr:hypothetical protein [Actinomycetospora callitridis]MDD7920041.1 hypothetical protein [Actinomycetospora callitridis]
MTEPQPPPLQADSPTALSDGRVVERYRPPGVGGGDFAVDLADAPRAIRGLEEAARELFDIRREAERLGKVTPPSRDQVSLDAATLLGVSAVGGNGSFLQALDQGIQQVNDLIAGLRSAMAGYGGADAQSAAALREP